MRKLVEHEKEVYGWEFLFLGANMDVIFATGRMGICNGIISMLEIEIQTILD